MKSLFIKINIWRKATIGLTGLGLSVFILAHMLGNLLLFVGEKEYNIYSHKLINNPGIIVIETLLLLVFAIHVIWALALTFFDKQAKGASPQKDSMNTLIQKTLWLQGIVILIFIIIHLITFKYGPYYKAEYDGQTVRNLFRLVSEVFQKPIYIVWYILSLVILSFHLNHGLQASIRSLGFYHEKYTPRIQKICLAYTLIVTLGFISQPLYVFFVQGGGFGL